MMRHVHNAHPPRSEFAFELVLADLLRFDRGLLGLPAGMSQQEWVRQVLRRTAGRFSPAELLAQRESSEPMSNADFARIRKKAAARHKAAAERLGATGRRR